MRIFSQLTKVGISAFASFSASAGFILAKGEISLQIVLPVIGILFLACGSCALNQYQEQKTDGLMERTKNRPLPSGKIHPQMALRIALGLIFLGFLILFYGTNRVSLGLGLFALLWYNGVYAYLKQKTAFATLPGALVGIIPPLVGWVSGGGKLFDPQIGVIAFFFFVWQIPHFWLLVLDFAEDYDRSGLPCLTRVFRIEQLKRVTLIWMLVTAVSSLFFSLFGFVRYEAVQVLLVIATLWLVWNAIHFLSSASREGSFRSAFLRLNTYVFLVIALLSFDKILNFGYERGTLISQVLAMMGFKLV